MGFLCLVNLLTNTVSMFEMKENGASLKNDLFKLVKLIIDSPSLVAVIPPREKKTTNNKLTAFQAFVNFFVKIALCFDALS